MGSIFGRMSTAILQYPSGRYGIVGSVPAELTELRRGVRQSMVFATEAEAIAALLAIGCTRFQRADCSWYEPTPIEAFAQELNAGAKIADVPFALTREAVKQSTRQNSLF